MGPVAGLVPKPVRDLLQSQRQSLLPEKDLLRFLSETDPNGLIHVHTECGVIPARWDGDCSMAAKTELDLHGSRVRVQRLVEDKNEPGKVVRSFARAGEDFLVDLEENRLLRMVDLSGWYLARLLEESPARDLSDSENELNYESDGMSDDVFGEDTESFVSVNHPPSRVTGVSEGFKVFSEPFEVSKALFIDKKINFPKEQRASYLKDLILKVRSKESAPSEKNLLFRVTLSRAPSAAHMILKGACLWDGLWFDLGDHFSKYFEHLHFLRTASLRKLRFKRALSEIAFYLLEQTNEAEAEALIQDRMKSLELPDEEARWEAAEYLKRFFKTFVLHETEVLLAGEDEWSLVPLHFRHWGALFWEVQTLFGGDLFDWLKTQQKEIDLDEFFMKVRALYGRLAEKNIELCFNQKKVQQARFHVKVRAEQKTEHGWFEMNPEVSWEGRPVSDAEWRRILENQGIRLEAEGLWVLDATSLLTLQHLRDLLQSPSGGRQKGPTASARVPRPQILDWVWLRHQGAEIELSPENEKLVQRLIHFEKIETRPVPEYFRGTLRDYQKQGYDWLAFLYEHRLGGCLADDMGLGKTVQAIAFLAGLKEKKIVPSWKAHEKVPHLIVVPTTLAFNWKQEFQRFYPALNVLEYSGGATRGEAFEKAEVIIAS